MRKLRFPNWPAKHLCPHQDYNYFAFPTKEEQEVDAFSQQKNALLQLTSDPLANTSKLCQALSGLRLGDDELLNEPKYLSATLIFLRSKELTFPTFPGPFRSQEITCFHPDWLEILLQGLVLSGASLVHLPVEYEKQLLHELKAASLIDRKQVKLVRNKNKRPPAQSIAWKTQCSSRNFQAEYQLLEANCANWF